ncbi:MAG: stage IV sporulation protein A [Oscillospiraceae bacterium]|nr:stage IV sporulation protein A [Oscillospiraceae bacterium]
MSRSIYNDISTRTNGDIYIGVVGPVRTGKSTFIKKFMETLVLPNIESDYQRERALDELPQSAAGKTIMTTEPKFIPEEAVPVNIDDSSTFNVRMIDCVGYIVPSSLGYVENEQPRMVVTPWFDQEIPFNMAAEIGTKKVITEHSTIGLVITCDGSISDIPRVEYEEAEERVISELKEINKPFVVLLNSNTPDSQETKNMSEELEKKYNVPVLIIDCLSLDETDINKILEMILFQFPIREISYKMPGWLLSLDKDHWLKKNIYDSIRESAVDLSKISDIKKSYNNIKDNEYIRDANISKIDLGKGKVYINLDINESLFYRVLEEITGVKIDPDVGVMTYIAELARIKKEYEKIKSALDEVESTGYGIVMPSINELSLEEPEIVKQGGRYGVRLKASAPSIHMMKANITTEVAPIVGSEKQSEELIMYLLQEFQESPQKIWSSNIFGKSLHDLVNEGLHNKLYKMPTDARMKLQETIERIINEGCGGLICIIL